MWQKVVLFVLAGILWQGSTIGDTLLPFHKNNGNPLGVLQVEEGGPSIVLEPEKSSVLATLEHLQKENEELREEMRQSQAQVMAVVQGLLEENTQLKKQQETSQAEMVKMASGLREEMRLQMQVVNTEVEKRVWEVLRVLEEMKGQQEVVVEQAGMVQSVLDVVQEFEDGAQNVSSQLTHFQDRMGSVEAGVRQLQVDRQDYAQELTELKRRMDALESLVRSLQSGQGKETPSPTPASTPTTTTIPLSTERVHTWPPLTTSPSPSPSTTGTVRTWPPPTTSSSPPPSTTEPTPRQFTIPPDFNDRGDSLITSILVTEGGQLIVGDLFASKLKMYRLNDPGFVVDVHRIHRPWALLELQDGTIAVTLEGQAKFAIVSITSDGFGPVRYIATERPYYAIAQGPDNTLIVGSRREDFRSASIDVIDLDGNKRRTLLQYADILVAPFCFQRFGDDLYVSDWVTKSVFFVNIHSGEVKQTVGDLDLSALKFFQPRKFDMDASGNLYVATGGRVCNANHDGYFCIVQVTQTGSWKVMDDYVPQNGGGYPYGVEVTSSQAIVSWCTWNGGWSSEVASYPLPEAQEKTTPGAPVTQGTQVTASSCGGKPCDLSNVALHKPALQSTYHPLYGHPERAVDGNKATAISQCTHTADVDSNPNRWWRVDLMGLFEVEAVVITNRGDCCGDRLTNFDIYVMDELLDPSEMKHDPNDLCQHHDLRIPNGATTKLMCGRQMVGRYVSLVLRTNQVPLNFCEIEVIGRPATATTEQEVSGDGSGDEEPESSGDVDYYYYIDI